MLTNPNDLRERLNMSHAQCVENKEAVDWHIDPSSAESAHPMMLSLLLYLHHPAITSRIALSAPPFTPPTRGEVVILISLLFYYFLRPPYPDSILVGFVFAL